MAGLNNCPNCGALFVESAFRDICDKCFKAEENAFDKVYKFIRQRVNRTATIEQIVKETGVQDKLIYKFIKKGRIKVSQFPNLGYPCDKCGRLIHEGKICKPCREELRSEIERHELEEARQKEIRESEKNSYLHRK